MLGRKMMSSNIHLLPFMFLPNLLTPEEIAKVTGRAQLLLSHTSRHVSIDTARHQPCKDDQKPFRSQEFVFCPDGRRIVRSRGNSM